METGTEIMITLPKEAIQLVVDIKSLPIIDVIDEKTNLAAYENIKIASKYKDSFIDLCEPERIKLRTPLDNLLNLIKQGKDTIQNFITDQKGIVGQYERKVIEKENERRRIEQQKINAERKAEIDLENEKRKVEAEADGKVAEVKTFTPIQEMPQIEQSRVKSSFVSGITKMKAQCCITDLALFMSACLETGNASRLNAIFGKYNESKLNEMAKDEKWDGIEKNFPGVHVELVPDVKVR